MHVRLREVVLQILNKFKGYSALGSKFGQSGSPPLLLIKQPSPTALENHASQIGAWFFVFAPKDPPRSGF